METVNILGLNFTNKTLDEVTDLALNRIISNEKTFVVTPNAEIAYMCKENNELKNIINKADLVLPDGIGIIYAGKILKKPLKEKVAGIEFSETLIKKAAKHEKSLYILGGKPNIAENACKNLQKKYSGLKIVGYNDGYFTNTDGIIEKINNACPDILLVCLGAPKQEKFIFDNINKLNAKVLIGAGGSADVFAGEVMRAPKIFINLGLEWFYRLLKQPSRFTRVIKLPLFLLDVVKYKGGSEI